MKRKRPNEDNLAARETSRDWVRNNRIVIALSDSSLNWNWKKNDHIRGHTKTCERGCGTSNYYCLDTTYTCTCTLRLSIWNSTHVRIFPVHTFSFSLTVLFLPQCLYATRMHFPTLRHVCWGSHAIYNDPSMQRGESWTISYAVKPNAVGKPTMPYLNVYTYVMSTLYSCSDKSKHRLKHHLKELPHYVLCDEA